MIHVGDKVRITTLGVVYTTYPGFLDYYREISSSTMIERVCSQYEYGRSPTLGEAQCNLYTVMFVREHGSMPGRKLAVVNDGEKTFIINVQGLTLVSSDLPFSEGDKVYIRDSNYVYSEWQKLVKHMSTVISDGAEVYQKWFNCRTPDAEEIDGNSPEAVFYVKWIGHHISRPDEAIVAIISNNIHTYIIGVNGLTKAGERSWDKYIIYVRNWAVVNKDSAQSVRDATGPKSYAEWLNNKS